jgi:hypothetical protein
MIVLRFEFLCYFLAKIFFPGKIPYREQKKLTQKIPSHSLAAYETSCLTTIPLITPDGLNGQWASLNKKN